MQGKLEFDLPMEQQEFQNALDGGKAKEVIEHFLFTSLKWKADAESEKPTTVGEMCEWCREEISTLLKEQGIDLE